MKDAKIREKAVDSIVHLLDSGFLTALTDPVRVQVIKRLVLNGRLSIEDISESFSQDRSVISRHLKHLFQEGIVSKEKVGRTVVYQIQAGEILSRFRTIASELERMIILCCGPIEK